MIEVKFFKNASQHNVLNKSITLVLTTQCDFTGELSIERPFIIADYDESLLSCNYAYIDVFKRYYHFSEAAKIENGFIKIQLEIDVLMSFKEDILNADITALRSTNKPNFYLSDSKVLFSNNTNIQTFRFPKSFETGNSGVKYVLKVGGI